MADSAWIESMQKNLSVRNRLDVWELVADSPLCNVIILKVAPSQILLCVGHLLDKMPTHHGFKSTFNKFKLVKRALESMVISDEGASYREDDQDKAKIYSYGSLGKSSTPLHCLAHSLNPRYYSDAWLSEDLARVAPHRDAEISQERIRCFRRLYPNVDDYDKILYEFATQTPLLQSLAFRVLDQLTSSSWLVIGAPTLLSTDQYLDEKTKMWDVGGDEFGTMEDTGFLEFAELSHEPEIETVFLSFSLRIPTS
ncbi:hypothetical protein Tco_0109818 [Tanacetum coccineum]